MSESNVYSLAEKITELEAENAELRKDKGRLRPQWQEIDYSQAEAGNAPFDLGTEYLLKLCDGYVGGAFVVGTWMHEFGDLWCTVLGNIPKEKVCEYMPAPEFLKG